MISLFFFTKKAIYNRQLLRIDVEVAGFRPLQNGKKVFPEILLFAAAGVYDHVEKKWYKFNYDSLLNQRLTESEMQTISPDEVKREVDHTFFEMFGLCWYLISDDRFYLEFRVACAKFCSYTASLKLGRTAECLALKEFFKSGCTGPLKEASDAYTYFPL